MKRPCGALFISLLLCCFFAVQAAASDSLPAYYFVAFKDKEASLQQYATGSDFLSERAVQRRKRFQIPIDAHDYPVSASYLDTLFSYDLQLIGSTKWLNGALVLSADTALPKVLSSYAFISRVELVDYVPTSKSFFEEEDPLVPYDEEVLDKYGHMCLLNATYLHEEGYRGEGIYIAVLDAGFIGVDTLGLYATTIHGVYDYVEQHSDVFNVSAHGTKVLSLMATAKHDFLQGTAPDATYFLYKTEDVFIESRVEEFYWLFAAENADSLGVDVINTSLGYAQFDNPEVDYTYADMDGTLAYISRASTLATSRGLMLVTSAGNMGNKTWKYITAPADAYGSLSIGAVDYDGVIAPFSSYGPASDGRIKPELVAPGRLIRVIDEKGQGGYGSGTSYSAPIVSGLVAALMQKYPNEHPASIRKALIQSADRYHKPDERYGYGMPDLRQADILLGIEKSRRESSTPLLVFPNPASSTVNVSLNEQVLTGEVVVKIFDIKGKEWSVESFAVDAYSTHHIFRIQLAQMPPGAYLCQTIAGDVAHTVKFIINPE